MYLFSTKIKMPALSLSLEEAVVYTATAADARIRACLFIPYFHTNVVNASSTFVDRHGGAHFTFPSVEKLGDVSYYNLAQAVRPGVQVVLLVASYTPSHLYGVPKRVVDCRDCFYDSPHTTSPLGYYDVTAGRLYLGDCDADRREMGIVFTDMRGFATHGVENTARVLCIDMHEYPEIDEETMRGLYRRLHRGYDVQEDFEKARNRAAWVYLLRKCVDRSECVGDNIDDLRAELRTLQGLEDLWPDAFEDVYVLQGRSCGFFHRGTFQLEDREPLRSFHLEHAVPFFTKADILYLRKYATVPVCAKALELLWPGSARCAWVTCCVQGAVLCGKEEEAAAKRRCL